MESLHDFRKNSKVEEACNEKVSCENCEEYNKDCPDCQKLNESNYATRPMDRGVSSTVFDKFEDMDAEFEKAVKYAEKFTKQDKARKAYAKAARQMIAALNLLKI